MKKKIVKIFAFIFLIILFFGGCTESTIKYFYAGKITSIEYIAKQSYGGEETFIVKTDKGYTFSFNKYELGIKKVDDELMIKATIFKNEGISNRTYYTIVK